MLFIVFLAVSYSEVQCKMLLLYSLCGLSCQSLHCQTIASASLSEGAAAETWLLLVLPELRRLFFLVHSPPAPFSFLLARTECHISYRDLILCLLSF